MSKKICILSFLIICIPFLLTGCTVNFNFNKDKNINDNTVQNNVEDEFTLKSVEDNYYDNYDENNKVNYTYVDLGNKYIYVIYEDDETNDYSWSYETEVTNIGDYSGVLKEYNDELVYIVDNGKLVALDLYNGEVLWKIENEEISDASFRIRENGTIDMCYGNNTKSFISIDKSGVVLKKIDLSEYIGIVEESYFIYIESDDDNFINIKYSSFNYSYSTTIKIDLNNYNVSLEKPELQDITPELLYGKTLYCEDGETYYFNSDGTFTISKNGNITEKYSIIRYSGTWSVESGSLYLKADKAIMACDGYYYDDEMGERIVLGYNEKEISVEMEREESIKYCANYEGKETVFMGYLIYEVIEPKG